MEENDNPMLLRVYRETVQRVPFTCSSLGSGASFVIALPLKSLVLVYHGRESSMTDIEVANELAKEFKAEEMGRKPLRDTGAGAKSKQGKSRGKGKDHESRNEVLSISEGGPSIPGDIMGIFLDTFWFTLEEYRFRCKVVTSMRNDQKTLYVIERAENSSNRFRLRKLGTSLPDRHGTVGLLPFPVYHPKKVALLVTGDQYDLWFGEYVSRDAQVYAKQLVQNMMNSSVPLGEGITKRENGMFDGVFYDAPFRIQYQGYEDPGFRSQFDTSVEFSRLQDPNPFVYIREKHSNELVCVSEATCNDVFSWVSWIAPTNTNASGSSTKPAGNDAQSYSAVEPGASRASSQVTPRKQGGGGGGGYLHGGEGLPGGSTPY